MVSSDYEEFWSALPKRVMHRIRVPMVEALWWIGEPLSATTTVDVLDGYITVSDAAYHLRVLKSLGVAEPVPNDTGSRRPKTSFEVRFRLVGQSNGFEDDRCAG
jgi:hypothetical protein